MDNVTYPYEAGSCWTLTSSHCGPDPVYAVFSKKVGNKLAIRAYFGGHAVEISPSGSVTVNGKIIAFFVVMTSVPISLDPSRTIQISP